MKAQKLNLFDIDNISIRTFWLTSFSFFACFFAWFGIVPFMPDVVKSLGLTPEQKYNSIVLAVTGTIFARLILGNLCDKFGPRLCYVFLLFFCSIPLFYLYFVDTYVGFAVCRFFIGFVGASFVITQYHTSQMFDDNCVGIANATSAGWGNLGGGANRLLMPIIGGVIISFGVSDLMVWRWAMVLMGCICLFIALLYYFFTIDTPLGNFIELRKKGEVIPQKKDTGKFIEALLDYRVIILFFVYAGCFGIELTVYGCMDGYLQNKFGLERHIAGYIVLSFALMNIFARTLGGYFGDLCGKKGVAGRIKFLAFIMVLEGIFLTLFSQIDILFIAILVLILLSLSLQMTEGATFAVVPFINKKCLGSVMGIVGAGGNVGAVFMGLCLKWNTTPVIDNAMRHAESTGLTTEKTNELLRFVESSANTEVFFIAGIAVIILGFLSLLIRFNKLKI